jgi:hypothetical protein
MTVKDLKKRLDKLDDNLMVIITDGEGWCNIEQVETKNNQVQILQETEPIFQDN